MYGGDMIRIAKLRTSIGKLDSINTAANLFKNKYLKLAGDMKNASNFWPEACNGDANERISGYLGTLVNGCAGGAQYEYQLVWRTMELAEMMPETKLYNGNKFSFAQNQATPNFDFISDAGMQMITQEYYAVGCGGNDPCLGGTVLMIGTPTSGSHAENTYFSNGGFPPMEVFMIDEKYDDGMPQQGKIRASSGESPQDCVITSQTFPNKNYNTTSLAKSCVLYYGLGI